MEGAEPVYKWRLYGRWGLQKRYRPINWRTGEQVVNLIFATIFTEEEKAKAEDSLQKTSEQNKGLQWEWRRI